jgi:ABC-type antimicrobial peptide transport system permease subunit
MFKNYLKTAVRNIIRQKTFSLINIAGLAIGMVCFILISLWVFNELSFNEFHTNKKRIFRINTQTDNLDLVIYSSWRLGPALKETYPEIEEFTRIWPFNSSLVKYKDKTFNETKFYLADPAFFMIFTFPFIHGNSASVLLDKNSIVITEETAHRYFGSEDPIGKMLFVRRYDQDFKVTGVIKNIPDNSSMRFDLIARVDLMPKQRLESWEFTGFTCVLLQDNINPDKMNNKIAGFYRDHVNSESTSIAMLQPLSRVHLYEYGDTGLIKQVYFFAIVALFVLIIACINFMNLNTARASRRAKEIGVRKVIGAQRIQIIQQFLGESIIISFFALILALFLIEALLPFFNEITNRQLSLINGQFTETIIYLFGFTLITGIFAGSYPAFFLSSYQPVKIIKSNNLTERNNQNFRKGLTIFQFVISIGLIIVTFVFHSQLNYVQNKNLGLNRDLIISIPVNPDLNNNFKLYKHELLKNKSVKNVTSAQNMPTNVGNFIGINWEGHINQDEITMAYTTTRLDFFKTFDIEFLYGRPFSEKFPADKNEAVIINETAMKMMDLNFPIGKKIYFNHPAFEESFKHTRIIGVVKDFHFRSLHDQIGPFIFRMYNPYQTFVFAKLNEANIQSSVEYIEEVTKKFAPDYPFNFVFLDEYYNTQYEYEIRIGKVFNFFAVLAIFISCLGLFGLVSFNVDQRVKEIGIRKVLGASVSGIITMLCKEFTKWVLLANIIAWPLAGFLMHHWLNNFVYKINIEWWIYVTAGSIALIIALITISSQAIKAAITNPVESLRYE